MRRWARSSRLWREDRGSATAETAIVLPLVVVLAAVLLVVGVGVSAQIRLEHAARGAARELARGEDPAAAIAVARQVAGENVSVGVSEDGAWVTVNATQSLSPPGGLLQDVTWRLQAQATAHREPHLVNAP